MPTRRDFLLGASAALLGVESASAKASQPAVAVNFSVPANACDCHTHIFGDPAHFPFSPARVYTPEPALPSEMRALHRALHIRRVVIVTPSVYGADNSATLYGMRARGRDARGVAVIDNRTKDTELDALERAGIRGIRLNLATTGEIDPARARERFQQAVARVQRLNWHIQMYTSLAVISALRDLVAASPVPVVFDHFGGAQAALGVEQPGFGILTELVRSGRAYVKVSGAYRASNNAPDYPDVAPLARALIAANPDRILWGSDWPHPNSSRRDAHAATDPSPLLPIDDARLLNQLPVWAPDTAVRLKILVYNPARLYGF